MTLLQTTATGRGQAETWASAYTAAAHELFSILSGKEQLALTELLQRLADSIDD